jgi:ethanolamine utilization protein EutN
MLRAVVVDNVWATRRLAELPNGAFLEVQVEDTGARLVAFDVLGSGIGERVLVAQGSVAAAWFPGKPPPLDALIVGSIDEPSHQLPEVEPTNPPAHAAPAPPTDSSGPVPEGN